MDKTTKQPVVLSIAGFDPSGGAGVLADIKTFQAFECYGLAVITSLSFQNTQQVFGVQNQNARITQQQLEPLFDDFEISAIKIGMLPTAEIVRAVAVIIRAHQVPVVVVDPVLQSSSGFSLIDARALDTLKMELFPLASLVTPNIEEAQRISGVVIKDHIDTERAAEAILRMGAGAVLITGGDADSSFSTDLLFDLQGTELFSTERVVSKHTHGTGCTFASALACLLVGGRSLRESVPVAKEYVAKAIAAAPAVGRGKGPLNHLPPDFRFEN
jgi:hydroxymethylpyrimidine/phosphomethylpyrimidine kinase